MMKDSSKQLNLQEFSPIAKLKNDNNMSLLKLEETLEEQIQFLEEENFPLEEEKPEEKKESKFEDLFLSRFRLFDLQLNTMKVRFAPTKLLNLMNQRSPK